MSVEENRAKLIAALRSGKYEQARGELRNKNGYCCLGVACDVSNPNIWEEKIVDNDVVFSYGNENFTVPANVREDFGLMYGVAAKMIEMNDTEMQTFDQIADWLEKVPIYKAR